MSTVKESLELHTFMWADLRFSSETKAQLYGMAYDVNIGLRWSGEGYVVSAVNTDGKCSVNFFQNLPAASLSEAKGAANVVLSINHLRPA